MVCRRYSRAYLRHLMQAGEPLAATLNSVHNLAYYLGIMQRVRQTLGGDAVPKGVDAAAVD
jgi:queuine tRNA-ribosyltransferase